MTRFLELDLKKLDFKQLTVREMEVLRLVLSGEDNRTIAERLGVKKSTVCKHRENILRKLGCSHFREVMVIVMGEICFELAVRNSCLSPTSYIESMQSVINS